MSAASGCRSNTLNVATGTVKRHAGGYVWETQIGGSASARVGFWGATPVAQPSGADQAAVALGNTDGEIGGLTISDLKTAFKLSDTQAAKIVRRIVGRVWFFQRALSLVPAK